MKKLILTTLFIVLFSIACGDNGSDDNTADTGNTADSGNTTDTGNTGNTGYTGDTGNTGNTGDTGEACGGNFPHEHDGLCWSDKASDHMNHADAISYCEGLGGHLPTISELRTLIQNCPDTETGGACGVTDSCLSYSHGRRGQDSIFIYSYPFRNFFSISSTSVFNSLFCPVSFSNLLISSPAEC